MTLHRAGVRIVMDQVSTNFAIFASLKNLPLNGIKLSHGLVKNLGHGGEEELIIGAMIDAAHRHCLTVTASGVENGICYDQLLSMQCDQVQGLIFAPPMTAEQLLNKSDITLSFADAYGQQALF